MNKLLSRCFLFVALSCFGAQVAFGQATPTVTLTTSCAAPCNAPASVTLTATATVASGRTISKIEFYEGATKLATDTTSPYSTTLANVTGGSHSYTAKVFDSAATPLTATSAAKVVAVNQAPTITLTAACTAPCTAPASVSLTASPADADGTITKVQFYRGTTLISTRTASPWTYTDTALAAGSYSYTAKATDNAATPLVTTSSAQAITVNAASTAPTVSLTATCTSPCVAPAAVALAATGTVASGRTIKKIEFYDGATLLNSDTTSPYSFGHSNVTGGAHSYTAKIYDSATTSLTATSSVVAITVNVAPTVTLTATCAASPCSAPATVNLTATPADSDGTISKVEFYRASTLIGTSTASPWTLSDAVSTSGTYTYTAKAFDSAVPQASTTSSGKSVTVSASTSVTYTLTPDGPDVAVNLPGSLTPILKFSAQAGDYLSLRVWNTTGAYIPGSFVLPANSAVFADAVPGATTTLLYGPSNSMGDGYMDLLVRTTGEYSIRLSGYGSSPQSLKFALLRTTSLVAAQLDGVERQATSTRLGQPLSYQFASASGLPHFACALLETPGWRDSNGNLVDASPSALANVRILSPSQRTLTAITGGDCISSGASYLQSSEPGTYTLIVTPTGQYMGGRKLALYAPQPASALVVDALPIQWVGTRQSMDGARFTFQGVAGKTYAIVVGKVAELEPYRNFSLQIEGANAATYYPSIETGTLSSPAAAWKSFTASVSGTIAVSVLGPGLDIPIAVSIAQDFAPTAVFADVTANKIYPEIPYLNGVLTSGNGKIPIKSVNVGAYRTGWSTNTTEGISGSSTAAILDSYAFSWPATPRDTVYGAPTPRTLAATVTLANNVSVRPSELLLTYATRSGLLSDPLALRNGMTTDDDQLSFSGIAMTDEANTSVLINDELRPVVGGSYFAPNNREGGRFAINELPLAIGANTITVSVHRLTGVQSYSFVVNRVAAASPKAFDVSIAPDWGVAPLSPEVVIKNLTAAAWQRVLVQVGKADPVSIVPGSGDTVSYRFTLTSASTSSKGGVVPVQIAILGAGDQRLLQTTRFVSLRGEAESINAAFGAYSHLRSRAAVGDASGALLAFSMGATEKFQPFLTSLGPDLPRFGQMANPNKWSLFGGAIQFEIPRDSKSYSVILVRDLADGLWRIYDL